MPDRTPDPTTARPCERRVTPAEGARAVMAAAQVADRLDALADTAELMGDDAGACRFRQQAAHVRLEAMDLLDHEPREPR